MVQGCFRSSRMLSRSGHLPTFCYAIQKYTNNVFLCSQKNGCIVSSHYDIQTLERASSHLCLFREETSQLKTGHHVPMLTPIIGKSNGITTTGLHNESVSPSWGGVCEKANTWTKSGLSYQGRKKVVKVVARMTFGKMSTTLILCFIKHRFTTILSST